MVKRFPGPRLAPSAPWSPCPMASPIMGRQEITWPPLGRPDGRPNGKRMAATGRDRPRREAKRREARGGGESRREACALKAAIGVFP